MTIRLTKQQRTRILNSTDLYTVMQAIFRREQKIDRNREHFWIMGLANDHTLLFVELIGLGSIRRVGVEPMDVYSLALQKRAVRIVLVHNHPSGKLVPSEEDKDLTDYLIQVGVFVNVPVLDHLIISETAYFSFADGGLLEQLQESRKHVLPYQERSRLLKDIRTSEARGEARGLEAGEAKKANAIALAMKAKGIEVGVIAEVTGLSVAKVKGLKLPKAKAAGSKAKAKGSKSKT
ncbi:MAG: DNA repair protein [Bacteroidetes bacterium]|nr:DNA repair protein [Bacteroidota bacterium]